MLDMLGLDLEPEDIIVLAAGLSAVLAVFVLWAAFVPDNPLASRARRLMAHREALRQEAIRPRRRGTNEKTLSMMKSVVSRMKLARRLSSSNLNVRLLRAGIRSPEAQVKYLFYKLALPVGFIGFAVFVLYVGELYQVSSSTKMMITIGAGALGFFGPDIYLMNRQTKRKKELTKALPDGLDLLVICAEAGLHLDSALNRVAEEMAQRSVDLADELALAAVELSFLPERKMALDNLAMRTNLPAVRGLVNTLIQTEKYGTPLAQSLRVLSAELRHERLMRAEEKAARLPAILTVPMIIFILPPLFIVLLSPAVLQAIDTAKETFK
ncbi:MAG: type II secretion system F family protein [Alphaproteobacteria bacterium]